MNLKRIAFIAAGVLLPSVAFAANALSEAGGLCDWCPF